jgi:predicted permease
MTNLLNDLRFALRQMRRSPGFALTAILTLALGIAANVIVFGVLQALILRPINVPQGDRVYTLGSTALAFPVFAYPEITDVRDNNTTFSAVGAFEVNNFGLEANGLTQPVWGFETSGQYFEVLNVKPFLGRLLTRADDDHPNASDAAVLSYPVWKSVFSSDPNIVGKQVRVNKHPYTVVGVTPQGFYGSERFIQPGIFAPIQNEESLEGVNWLHQRHDKNIFAIARLKDGITLPQAQADLQLVAARMIQQYPKEEEGMAFTLSRPGLIGNFLGRPARAFLAGVMGLAGIVLLAACANLGSLFAARTADRAREIAVRMAIGSSRWRVLRQVLVEAVLISLLGGACACILAWAALTGIANWHPPSDFPIQLTVLPQPSLVLIAFAISLCAGILFGIMPLRQIFKTDPNEAIKSGAAASGAGRRWALRDILLAAQIALCCVTVTAAFVALRGMARVLTMDLGFQPHNAVITKFDLSQAAYSVKDSLPMQRRILDAVAHAPGVQSAALADVTPMDGPNQSDVFAQQTTDYTPSNEAFDDYIFNISPGFFATAQTPLLAGRDVTFADTPDTPPVAVVNLEFARRLLHTKSNEAAAVGRIYKNRTGKQIQIVGLVADGKYLTLSETPAPAAFMPISQNPQTNASVVVRTSGDPRAMAVTIPKIIHDLDPAIPIRSSSVWTTALALNFFPAQVATATLSVFGAFGLLLSIAGTFGLASYTVSKRLRELSIRVALGAQARQILSAALGRMLTLLAAGCLVGIALGAATSHLLSAIVYHATAQDPVVLAAVALTMLLTGLLSVTAPVRRALHIDPANILRNE